MLDGKPLNSWPGLAGAGGRERPQQPTNGVVIGCALTPHHACAHRSLQRTQDDKCPSNTSPHSYYRYWSPPAHHSSSHVLWVWTADPAGLPATLRDQLHERLCGGVGCGHGRVHIRRAIKGSRSGRIEGKGRSRSVRGGAAAAAITSREVDRWTN